MRLILIDRIQNHLGNQLQSHQEELVEDSLASEHGCEGCSWFLIRWGGKTYPNCGQDHSLSFSPGLHRWRKPAEQKPHLLLLPDCGCMWPPASRACLCDVPGIVSQINLSPLNCFCRYWIIATGLTVKGQAVNNISQKLTGTTSFLARV